MAGIDQVFEVLGRPEAAGRREKPEHLVAPGTRERVLHDRQQLEVRESQVFHVRDEPMRQLAIGEEAIAFLRHARPRAKMHFVARHRTIQPTTESRPGRHPVPVAPGVLGDIPDDGRGQGRHFERDPEGVALLQHCPLTGTDLELILHPIREVGNEQLPDAVGQEQTHRGHTAVPAVEVADQADAFGVGRPYGEMHAGGRPDRETVRAELFERADVRAFPEQMQVEIGEHAAIAVRIVELGDVFADGSDA